ncbi:sensor histidine kinase [Plantactinospora sp. GCM10030261]|uniref:sensor histidine kinase n=1 Tax=Plantactinospora sp. GCM10030261 TaxID=3273420 RepID=UPI00362195F9
MSPRAVFAPLVSGSTYRRAVFLLLGGVLLLPYLMLAAVFWQMLTTAEVPLGPVISLLAVAAVIAATPVFLAGSRALEIAAARSLLDVELPDPVPGRPIDRETRLRGALWIATHLGVGGLVMFGLISVFPMALVFVLQQFGIGGEALDGRRFGPWDADGGWLALFGAVALLVMAYSVAGLGALARSMAPVLLGPSERERIASLEERAERLAERNRLARELHDSIGHALTVATLQAGAAREVLDADPAFARRALAAIEETGRRAMEELDHVLGVLRQGEAPGREPQRTLADLDRLVADTRAAGLSVRVRVEGSVDGLPPAVSREGYRIVQEGLTNAVRHGAGDEVSLRIGVPPNGLDIELVNAAPADAAGAGHGGPPAGPVPAVAAGRGSGGSGRGLTGMRERVALLGGRMTAGPDADGWRVSVRLPVTGTGTG